MGNTTRLHKLSLRAFRSFTEEATIEFPESGLVLIRGNNADHPGVSSGAGKTSVLLALSYALKYCPFPATELQSWLTEDSMQVGLEFTAGEDRCELSRGQKTSLTTTVERGSQKVSGASADKKLESLIGLDPVLLQALTYRPQRERGLFLSKTDAEKKEFLSVLLKLDTFEAAAEECKGKIVALEEEHKKANFRTLNAKTQLDEVLARKLPELVDEAPFHDLVESREKEYLLAEDEYESVTKEHDKLLENNRVAVEVLRSQGKAKYNAAKELLEAEQLEEAPRVNSDEYDALRNVYTELQRRITQRIASEDARQADLAKEIEELRAKIWKLKSEEGRIKEYQGSKLKLEKQVVELSDSKCPTCHRQWDDSVKTLEELQHEIRKLDAKIKAAQDGLQAVADYQKMVEERLGKMREKDPTLDKLREAEKSLNTKLAEAKAKIDTARQAWESKVALKKAETTAKLAEIVAETESAISVLRKNQELIEKASSETINRTYKSLTDIEGKINIAKMELKNTQKENARIKAEREAIEQTRQKASASLQEAQNNLSQVETALKAEQDFQSLTKGFLGAIFDEVLAEIADETNKMLAPVPNVSTVTIRFTSEAITQKGTVKRSIIPVLSVGGHEHPLRSALSGGMQSAVELAVDLAVRKVIARRTGCNPAWLVLDESFEGLGAVEKEAVMAILRNEAKDTLILVVDHSSETKELFSSVINVENKNGRSTIR